MNYTEKELLHLLDKLFVLMDSKIVSSITPNVNDLEFLKQLRAFRGSLFRKNGTPEKFRSKIETQLRTFLKKGNSWEKLKTPIESVSIIKVPLKRQECAVLRLVIEFMKRDIDVKNSKVFYDLRKVIDDARMYILIKEIDNVNSMKIRIPS